MLMKVPILCSLSVMICAVCCGSEDEKVTPCDEAREIQKQICQGSENCFPCTCVLNGEDWEMGEDEFRIPDRSLSSCMEPVECEGQALEDAIKCIEDDWTCDPRYHQGILLFTNGEPEPAFPDFCDSP